MTEKEMIELFAKKQSSAHYLCPRCGKDAMADDPVRNALSRRASVHVCDACGAGEAMWDFAHTDREPLAAWAISMWPSKYSMVESDGDGIAIEGHRGTWYVIDEGNFAKESEEPTEVSHLFLLEHEEYGDEAACLIVDRSGNIMMDDVWNGFDDLEEAGWVRLEGDIR